MKNILISGASRGIGWALVQKYLQNGNRVFAVSRNISNFIALKEQFPNTFDFASCDVSDKSDVDNAIQNAGNFLNKIELAILNAGISSSENFENFSSEKYKYIFNTNLFGVLHFFEYLIPSMKNNNGGTIAVTSSLADVRGFAGSAAYSSSKAALTRTLEAARAELHRFNIKIVTIRPGFVRTDMTAKNRFPMPFMIDAGQAAEIIINALDAGKARINFPLPTYLITNLLQMMPDALFDFVMKFYKVSIDE
ncbi:MAG: SDR family NAD(P)-dependent oxidoreductase [Bacteroidota bacterium]